MILSCPLGSSSHAGWPCLPSLGPHSHPKQILFPDPRQRACDALPDSLLVELLELRPVPCVKLPALTPPLVLLDAASFPSSRHFAVCQCGSPGSPVCIANFLPISALLPPSSFPPTLVPFHPQHSTAKLCSSVPPTASPRALSCLFRSPHRRLSWYFNPSAQSFSLVLPLSLLLFSSSTLFRTAIYRNLRSNSNHPQQASLDFSFGPQLKPSHPTKHVSCIPFSSLLSLPLGLPPLQVSSLWHAWNQPANLRHPGNLSAAKLTHPAVTLHQRHSSSTSLNMAAPPGAAPAAPAAPAVQYAQLPSFRPAKHVNKRVDLPAEAYVDLSPYVSQPHSLSHHASHASPFHHAHGPQLTIASTVG